MTFPPRQDDGRPTCNHLRAAQTGYAPAGTTALLDDDGHPQFMSLPYFVKVWIMADLNRVSPHPIARSMNGALERPQAREKWNAADLA